jgi:hypothetical protein
MKIYRYRPMGQPDLDDRVQAILTDGELWFPSPAQLNDPFDPIRQSIATTSADDLRPLVRKAIDDKSPGLTEAEKKDIEEQILSPPFRGRFDQLVNDLLDRSGISCFSERNDEILMWSHYTNGHKGICLEFDKDILDREWQHFYGVRKVTYTDSLPNFNPNLPPMDRTASLVLTKYSGWSYEREWRAVRILETGKGLGLIKFPPSSLTGVVFGCKTPDLERDQIRAWVSAGPCKGVRFFEARMRGLAFALDVAPCIP